MDIPRELVPWFLGIVGAFIGSFLNVCIYRIPAHRSIVRPGSACPACGAPIRPWQNVPVVSWLLLRGRCASCRAPISPRYPFVEALTAAVFAAAALRFDLGWDLARALVFLSAMIVLFFTDLDERILPDLVTKPGTVAGLLFAFFGATGSPFASRQGLRASLEALGVSLATAAVAAGSLWLLGRLWRLVRPEIESAMGLGDVKMMAMVGAFLGPRLTLLTVFLGSLLGTLIFLVTKVATAFLGTRRGGPAPLQALRRGLESAGFLVGGEAAGLLDQIPFGSLLALGGAVSIFGGERLIGAYLAFTFWLGDWIFDAIQSVRGSSA
jgi:leader peptidase (prepilin peptidase)/N-methyltransferase